MKTIGRIDELGRDPKFVTSFVYAAFQNRIHVQLLAELAEDAVLGFAFESEGCTAPGHAKSFHFRQHVKQLFVSHAVAQILVVLVHAQIHERQHRDRFCVNERTLGFVRGTEGRWRLHAQGLALGGASTNLSKAKYGQAPGPVSR